MRKLFLISCLIGLFPILLVAQNEKKKVMVMDIKAEIDPRVSRYVNLALANAEKINADYIIIDMDTFGGALADAKEIVDMLMDEKRPLWVFVNADAASAGALISIACDSIHWGRCS